MTSLVKIKSYNHFLIIFLTSHIHSHADLYTNPICRKNQYDQVEEYHVDVREKGQRKEEESQEEVRKSTEQLEAVGVTGRDKCSCDFPLVINAMCKYSGISTISTI